MMDGVYSPMMERNPPPDDNCNKMTDQAGQLIKLLGHNLH